MSIFFSLILKRWRELFIVFLLGIILLMRGCGSENYGDKQIIDVDGKDYELLEQKVDTVFVEKEVVVEKYIPKYITKEVIKEVEIPANVDSLAIVREYFASYKVVDTLNLQYDFPDEVTDVDGNKPVGNLGFGVLTDIISQNAVQSREIEWNFKIPTVYNTTIVKELPKNEWYVGFGGGFDQPNFLNNIRGSLMLRTKKFKVFTIDLGLSNQVQDPIIGTSKLEPFIGGSMYWKLGKKE